MEFRKGVFIITEESHCPLYNVGEELVVDEISLKFPEGKPTCLILAHDIFMIASEGQAFEKFSKGEVQRAKFECGGCSGIIRFEFKKEKEFATLQMKLLALTDRKDKIKRVTEFAGLLRTIDLFKTLTDDDLLDLAALLVLERYEWGFPIAQKGDPGTNLFIIVSGRVEVVDEDGVTLAEMRDGDVFGEMSLLTGDKVTATIVAAEPCKIAKMSQKNFRHILNRFPTLQVFFYKLLVSRITAINLKRAEELSSGMVGQLSDIPPVELCQMINSLQKSGRLAIDTNETKAFLLFYEGEVLQAFYNEFDGKEAFYKIMAMTRGRFKFVQGLTAAEKKRDVIGGFMAMLMEGMRRIDDKG
ncbi:MAG: cyclic nucleotide-binding domain-containing protein [Desulfocapsaceae bacterium]|nr:cyclic nucleotide-binding domain-containing protein [Desulfocapsaceae bacterium]